MDQQQQPFQRRMYQGNWQCSQCGAEITELPFEPDGTRPVYCGNCYRPKDRSPR